MLGDLNDESLEPVVSSTRNMESHLNILSGENPKHSPH